MDNYLLTARERLSLAALVVAVVAALYLSACGSPHTPRGPHRDPVVADEYARVVRIKVLCPDGSVSGGSGVRIGGSTILTARHVVDCGGGVEGVTLVQIPGGKSYITLVEGTTSADVARLEAIGIPELPAVRIAGAVIGTTACSVFAAPELGRRCGEVWPFGKGTAGNIRVDFVAEMGNSGAAMWDSSGALIGIVVHLRYCRGTGVPQVCLAGATSLVGRRWLAAP